MDAERIEVAQHDRRAISRDDVPVAEHPPCPSGHDIGIVEESASSLARQ